MAWRASASEACRRRPGCSAVGWPGPRRAPSRKCGSVPRPTGRPKACPTAPRKARRRLPAHQGVPCAWLFAPAAPGRRRRCAPSGRQSPARGGRARRRALPAGRCGFARPGGRVGGAGPACRLSHRSGAGRPPRPGRQGVAALPPDRLSRRPGQRIARRDGGLGLGLVGGRHGRSVRGRKVRISVATQPAVSERAIEAKELGFARAGGGAGGSGTRAPISCPQGRNPP